MKRYTVPPVPIDLLMKAHQPILDVEGKGDASVTVAMALGAQHNADDLLACVYRLSALQKIVNSGKGPAWVMENTGKPYKLVNDAMFRAAARTTLRYTSEHQSVADIVFDSDEFLKNALEESEPGGKA